MTQFMWLENLLKISFTFDHKKDETEKVNEATAELFSSIRFIPPKKRLVYYERNIFAKSL